MGRRSSGLGLLVAFLFGGCAGFLLAMFKNPPQIKQEAEADLPPNTPDGLLDWIKSHMSSKPKQVPRIMGIVDIQPELKNKIGPTDCLFIIVTTPGEQAPLAVKKIFPVSLPFIYTIGPENRMFLDKPFQGPVDLNARIDKNGEADFPQAGDLTGHAAGGPFPIPSSDVHILINTVVSGRRSK